MGAAPPRLLRVSAVPLNQADEAFAFHLTVAQTDEHIWPRTSQDLQHFAEEGLLFGARRADTTTQELVALCYVKREGESEYEIGGLAVASEFQKIGIGTLLIRFALAHVIVYESPLQNQESIVAFVHESNNSPRGLLKILGFEQTGSPVEVPGATAPLDEAKYSGQRCGPQIPIHEGGTSRLVAVVSGLQRHSRRDEC